MGTALVTGASAGLGAEFCRELAEQGHDVVLTARSQDALDALAHELRSRYAVRTEVIVADLATEAGRRAVADRAAASTPSPIDILVNNAGFGVAAPFLETTVEEEEAMFAVLSQAVLVVTHAAARAMAARGRGAILNVASISSFMTTGTYSAAKAWVTVFTEGIAGELKPHGVTVTAVHPGLTHTEFHERAAMDIADFPELLWLDARSVVREGIAAAKRGQVVHIPSLRYKVAAAAFRALPRPVQRALSPQTSRVDGA